MTEHAEPVAASTEKSSIKVKKEKIDSEVEEKLKSLEKAKGKTENNTTVDGSNDEHSDSDSDNSERTILETDDKKSIAPVKSSNEILAELFGVFNAAPPEELLSDKNLIKKSVRHKKVKKEKKEKKKRHKRERSDDEWSNAEIKSTAAVNEDGKNKHKKKKKHKHKHKDNKEKHVKVRNRDNSREKEKSKDRIDVKRDVEKLHDRTKENSQCGTNLSHMKSEESRDRKRNSNDEQVDASLAKSCRRERSTELERDSTHNNFYNGFRNRYEETTRKSNNEKEHRHSQSNLRSDKQTDSCRNGSYSDLSLSDEETYLRERENGRKRHDDAGETITTSNRSHNSFYSNSGLSRRGRAGSNDRDDKRRTRRKRSRSRSRSRSYDLNIDKKRLLEIARKNAISMFKRGQMPGAELMTQEVKDKVLLKMRYGGRTVEDLTEFCKKISNGEDLPDLSSDEDSDVDKNGNAKAFHHPFQLKEREPIVMHIRNSTPVVPARRTEDLTKAITMQFPVSSGQQHRNSEGWVPVDKSSLAPLPQLPPVKQSTSIFKDLQPKNVFEKPIPMAEQQEPAFKPVNTVNTAAIMPNIPLQPPVPLLNDKMMNNIMPAPIPAPPMLIPPVTPTPVAPILKPFVPEVPIPSTSIIAPQQNNMVFNEVKTPDVDVSSIITKRLSAIRKLQENPTDPEALKMMYNAQRDMSSWASSKHIPGQFTGSTGANIMKAHELNSGPQLWVRRDQLTSTKPVTGGMGMALLQKMGWKPGEGLGPAKTGSLQPLLLDVKLDKRGLVSREDNCFQRPTPAPAQRSKKNPPPGQNRVIIENKHPVCVLNELTSKNKWTPPKYTLLDDKSPAHNRMFLFSVEVNGQKFIPTHASNTKKEAKMMAAKMCLQQLGILPS